MSRNVARVSIVCPAFNEEEALPRFHHELLRVVERLQADYDVEIVYVDDGSRDRTLLLLRQWASEDARIRYLSFSRNFGHQAAMTAGMDQARGDVVVTMDSDLQHPPDLIPTLLAKWREGYEIVVTIRADDPTLTRFKRWSSHWFYVFMRFFSDTELRSAAADFRLLSRKALTAMGQLRETHRFLRGMVQWLGFPTAEVPFEPAQRAGGVSKFNLRKMVAFAIDGLVSFSRAPLRLPFYAGTAVLALGAGLGSVAVAQALMGRPAGDWMATVTLVDLHVLAGLVLCGLGIVGEYVGRIFDQIRNRPIYLIKETEQDLTAGRVRWLPPEMMSGNKQPGAAA